MCSGFRAPNDPPEHGQKIALSQGVFELGQRISNRVCVEIASGLRQKVSDR